MSEATVIKRNSIELSTFLMQFLTCSVKRAEAASFQIVPCEPAGAFSDFIFQKIDEH